MQLSLSRMILILLCALLAFHPAKADEKSYVFARSISVQDWQRLTNDKAFSYKKDLEKAEKKRDTETPKFLKSLYKWMAIFWYAIMNSIVLWIIIALVAIYIIYKLVLANDGIAFGRKKKNVGGDEAGEENEDIGATNWDILLQKAVQNNELQLAVRYSYMWLLQMLQEAELIKYRTDKTNFEYYRELEETAFKQPFKQLSRQYEYTHYGNYAITPGAYNSYIEIFNGVKKQLHK